MKKQKSIFVVLLSTALIGFYGCDEKLNNNSNNEELTESTKEIAIDITQEKENLQFIESIFENENSEFLEGDLIQSIPQKVRRMKVVATEGGDTIKNADEVPVYTS